uniref:Uncharacterized protein n=1 Tax=Anguilla anguilla TaxID=7936 RepID=A0A0E9QQX3_ANGAN
MDKSKNFSDASEDEDDKKALPPAILTWDPLETLCKLCVPPVCFYSLKAGLHLLILFNFRQNK